MLKEGTVAPQFQVQNHQGKSVQLKSLQGKKVVLWFYPKADTPGCTAEACGFRDRFSSFQGKNVEVLGVSFDTVEENRAFADKFHLEFPLLCDTDKSIGMAYGACENTDDKYAKRIAYIIDEKGKVQKAYEKVDAKTFPTTVIHDLGL